MGVIDEILSVWERWNTIGYKGKALLLLSLIIVLLLSILTLINTADQTYSILTKWEITEKLDSAIGTTITFLYYLLKFIIIIGIACIGIVSILYHAQIVQFVKAKRILAQIFSRAFRIYRDNPIMIVPSLFLIAALILSLVIFAGYMGLIAVYSEEGFVAFSAVAGLFLFIILMIVLFFLAEGMTIEMIREASTGNKAYLSDAWQATMARIEPLVLTSLLAGIVVALGYVFFLIPGVILSFAFYFVAQTVMIDGKSGTQALKASYRFVEANLSDALIVILASLAIGVMLSSIPFIGALISLLSLPYIYGLATLLYLDGKEVQEESQKVPKIAAEVS
jgi:hypothetical protein